jgi:glycosyltransferase involved in cell wall biosynthesis
MGDGTETAVSVVIPALNAAGTIGATLAAIARQDLAEDYEVIVVDDESSDETAEIAARAPVVTAVIQQDRQGAAAARNRGAAAATGGVLAFTDSDCMPEPSWLAAGLRAIATADLVQGAVAPPPGTTLQPFDRSLWVSGETGLWESANLFVRRELFDRIGGFEAWLDHGGGRPFAEDTWFGWRARRAGARTRFSDDAVVHHAVFPRSFREYVGERVRLQYFPAVVRQMPELRAHVYRGRFLTRRSAAFDVALAGAAVALARRSPLPLVAVVPYAVEVGRAALPWRRRAASMAAAVVAQDLVGFASLARGSVRARTLLL